MSRLVLPFVGLLLSALAASAEYRSIAIEISRDAAKKELKVSIHSDEGAENRKDVSLKEATGVVEKVVGWGSGVGVVIVVEGPALAEYFSLLEAMAKNFHLDLMYLGPPGSKAGDQMLNYFRELKKRKQVPAAPATEPK